MLPGAADKGFFVCLAIRTPHVSKGLRWLRGRKNGKPCMALARRVMPSAPCDAPARPSTERKRDIQNPVKAGKSQRTANNLLGGASDERLAKPVVRDAVGR